MKYNYHHLEAIDNISKNVIKKRNEQNLSQSHLSALSDIDKSSIVKIEKMTHSNLTIKTLSKLASGLFGISFEELVTVVDKTPF